MKQPVIDSLTNLFGQNARIHFDTYVEPTMIDSLGVMSSSFWPLEYLILLLFLAITAVIIYWSEDVIGRVFKMLFSFPAMMRQLNYVNQSVDIVTRRIAGLGLIIFPLTVIARRRAENPNLFYDGDYSIIFNLLYLLLIVCAYQEIMKVIFLKFFRNRAFYRKLFLAERICVSSYVIFLFPLSLLVMVASPYQNTLNTVQLLLIGLFYIHFIITDFKLFIEEKVSYVQLILYFCTVNVVSLCFIIYFCVRFVFPDAVNF